MIMKKFDKTKMPMTAAELYILNCKKWRDNHPRKPAKDTRKALYPVGGCKIYIGFL